MRPTRIIAAVALAAAVAAAGSYLALTTAHQSEVAAPTQSATATSTPTIARATHRSTRPPTTNPAPSPPAACRTAQLELRAGQEEHAMHHVYITYGLRNRSRVACTMTGTPGVQLLDAHGSVVPTVLYPDAEPAATVLLGPGGWAFFTLGEVVLPEASDPQPCPAASTLVITPPDQQQAVTLQSGLAPCGGRLSVSVVRPTGELAPIQ